MKYINILMALFLILDLISSIGVVYIRRNTAKYFISKDSLEQNIIYLNEDYNHLQLEKLMLIDDDRVKKYAKKKGFHLLKNNEIKVLKKEKNVNSK